MLPTTARRRARGAGTGAAPPGQAGSAGRHLHAGRLTYAILLLFTAGSLFPLIWTAIAASRNNQRLAETPPPFWFGGGTCSATWPRRGRTRTWARHC